jgi:hypothetical protein
MAMSRETEKRVPMSQNVNYGKERFGPKWNAEVSSSAATPVFDARVDEQKWKEYEREYILPCFTWAKEYGIDLEKLVRDNAGHNCVELLVQELGRRAAHAAGQAERAAVPDLTAELRELSAKWRDRPERYSKEWNNIQRPVSEIARVNQFQCADELDALIAKLAPKESK